MRSCLVCADRFEAYCRALTGSVLWGGQLEVRALASALGVPIDIYRAYEEPLRMDPEGPAPAATEPLRISCARARNAVALGYGVGAIATCFKQNAFANQVALGAQVPSEILHARRALQ